MDNNKTFVFMIVLATTFIAMNLYFYYTRPKVVQSDLTDDITNKTAVYDASGLASDGISADKDRFVIINQNRDYEDNLIYENDKILLEFTPYGGSVKRAIIKNQNKNSKADVNLINKDIDMYAMELKLGSWAKGKTVGELTGGDDFFNVKVEGNKYIFTCELHDNANDITYTINKIYTVLPDENIFKLDVQLSNDKNTANKFDSTDAAYSIGWGPSLNQNDSKFDKRYDHFAYFNGKKLTRVDSGSKLIRQSPIADYAVKTRDVKDTYLARNDRYFTVLILPDSQNYNYFFDYRKSSDNIFYTGFERTTKNSIIKSEYYVYMGPQLRKVLKKYNDYIDEKNNINIVESKFSKSVRPIL